MGARFETGKGVAQDYKQAAYWYDKATLQGNVRAQVSLGNLYHFGRGVPKNDRAAIGVYSLAALQGNAIAQFNIGIRHYLGEGVEKDIVVAHAWFNIASTHGHEDGRKNCDALEVEMSPQEISEALVIAKKWMQANRP